MPLLPTIEEEDKLSWLRLMWRYRRQFQALASASAVFCAGGMKLAWCVFQEPSGRLPSVAGTYWLIASWFLGGVLGAIAAATFVQRLSKNAAHCSSGALLLLGGILSAVLPLHSAALFASCVLQGFALALTHVQALVTGGEVAHPDIRGLLLSSMRVFLWLGVCLQLLCARLWFGLEPAAGYALHIDQLHGLLIALLGVAAVVLALVYGIESPVLLQRQQRELAATTALKRLLGARYPDTPMLHAREDCKQLLAFDAGLGPWTALRRHNALPLLKVVTLRCFAALSMSLPFNRTFMTVSWSGFGCAANCGYALPVCGLLGSLAGGLLIDKHGRRKLCVVTLLLTGIFIFIVGGIFHHLESTQMLIKTLDLETAACLMMLYQFFTSMGTALAATVYTAEAFSLAAKGKCMAAAVASDLLLQAALVAVAADPDFSKAAFFFAMGSLSLLLGLLTFFFMPETKYLPLIECLWKFKQTP